VPGVIDECSFVLFGPAHVVALAVTLLLAVAVTRISPSPEVSTLARLLATALLVIALLKPPVFVLAYGTPWTRSLPLDLCRINEILCAYMLLSRSYRTFEVAYFLALAGSVSALLMPDLLHGFPDPRFLLFFASHGLAVLAALYAVSAYRFRPTLRSVGVVLTFLGGYTLAISGLNLLLDTNYLFLRRKPEGASVLDHLGPWPYYLVGLIGIAIVACFVCYLPFALRGLRRGGAKVS
jgi:hypothetical integral membrane protein (TIGR02206 family)